MCRGAQVGVRVGVDVLPPGVLVGVLVPGVPHTFVYSTTSSIHHPVAATLLSVPSLKRTITSWPAYAPKLTSTWVQVDWLIVHACLPARGLLKAVDMVPLYPPTAIVWVSQVVPASVDTSITPPSYAVVGFSNKYMCQKLNTAPTAPAGTCMGAVVTRRWSDMLDTSGANAEFTPEWGVGTAAQ